MNNKEYQQIYDEMIRHGLPVPDEKVDIHIPNAKTVLENAYRYFLSKQNVELIWRKEYDHVADWLEKNEGRGLLLYGDCGLGKSMLSRYVIPAIVLRYQRKVIKSFTAQQMNKNIDEILSKKLISLDDIGTEDVSVEFGNKRVAFAEVMDAVERDSKLVIISTNLQGSGIEDRYGTRTLERIISTTKRIEFKGESLRV